MEYSATDMLASVGAVLLALLPGGLWCAWFLWAVNWNKLSAALRAGAWAPVVLLGLISASVWSRLAPSECHCLGFVVLPNFWWQLGSVAALAAVALFCGWLQTIMQWTPADLNLDPPQHADHGHHAGHDHHAH